MVKYVWKLLQPFCVLFLRFFLEIFIRGFLRYFDVLFKEMQFCWSRLRGFLWENPRNRFFGRTRIVSWGFWEDFWDIWVDFGLKILRNFRFWGFKWFEKRILMLKRGPFRSKNLVKKDCKGKRRIWELSTMFLKNSSLNCS